jgi:Zn-dependent M28 family amino/carboxypeptidase
VSRRFLPLVLLALALVSSLPLVMRHYAYLPLYGYEGLLPAETAEERALERRLKEHVVAVASVPHNTETPKALEASAVYIERELSALGYKVERQEYEAGGVKVRNIHVVLGRTGPGRPAFVVGAHYDSALGSPGANDNGSGTAALLELARLMRGYESKLQYLRLVFFVNEEAPYFGTEAMGSMQFARMLTSREPVSGMISIETIGAYFDQPGSQHFPVPLNFIYRDTGNFLTFVGMPRGRDLVHQTIGSFRRHTLFPSIGGISHAFVKGIAWSDHASFDQLGVPAVMITDTALFRYAHYHKPTDTPDKIDYGRLARVTKGMERMLREIVD